MDAKTAQPLSSKAMHVGSTKYTYLCNMGTLPLYLDVFALTARSDMPGMIAAPDGKSNQTLTPGQLVANDMTIYAAGSSYNWQNWQISPFDFPSLVKYFKIKQVLTERQIPGLRSLRILHPPDFTSKWVDTRGAGGIGSTDGTHPGLWAWRKGQTYLLFKQYGFFGPDSRGLANLTEDPTTGVFTQAASQIANSIAHIARSSGTMAIVEITEMNLKQIEDNTATEYSSDVVLSAFEPSTLLPLRVEQHY